MEQFKFEVGFSFLKQDEAIAFEINDAIQDRFSSFIYSRKQEELGGTDGEKAFNEIFYSQTRIVALLYRDGWGETPWTRIEETAIKNRAFDKDWDFLLVINLDNKSSLPKWIPRTYIWLDYQRYKVEGAIAVIEHKIKEKGGATRQETIEDKAERLKRLRIAEKERMTFLKSPESTKSAYKELNYIINRLKELKPKIEDSTTSLHLSTSERPFPPMYEFGYHGLCLCVNNSIPFEEKDGVLKVTIYKKSGTRYFDYKETPIQESILKFDRDLIGNNGWSEFHSGKNFEKSEDLVNKWGKSFLNEISKM